MGDAKVRFAIAGTGHMAYQHAAAMRRSRKCELVAVVSADRKRADAFSRRLGVEGFTDYDAVLRREDVDAVDIATCNNLHADLGIRAAKAGKHVLVEKPIDISVSKAERLIEACRNNKVLLSVISQKRFDSALQKVKDLVDSGKLGDVFLASASVRWARSQEYYEGSGGWKKEAKCAGGGVLMYQAIHFIDVLLWILGPVASVTAEKMTSTHSIGVEDTAAGILRFKRGAMGCIDATTSVKCNMPDRIEIHGKKGSVVVERNRFVGWSFRKNPVSSLIESKSRSIIPMRLGTVGDQIDDFCRAVISGGDVAVSGEDGKAALEVVAALYESSAKGRTVKIGG